MRASPTERSSCWASRIGRSGTPLRLPRGEQLSTGHSRSEGGARTWCRRQSQPPHVDECPDWRRIAVLYGELAGLTGSPIVELNRAVAIAEAGDIASALALVERLELDSYHYLHATRAELLRRLDRPDEARAAYARALELVRSEPEQRFLERRLAELRS